MLPCDEVVTQQSTAGVGLQDFLAGHHWAYFVLHEPFVQRILAVDAAVGFEAVEEELQQVVQSSMSGHKLFGASWKHLATAKVDTTIRKVKESIEGLARVSSNKVRELKNAALKAIEETPSVEIVPMRRSVRVAFRDMLLEVPVRSHGEFLELQCMATVKCIAVDCGVLTALPIESGMGGATTNVQQVEFEEGILWQSRQSRRYILL